MLEHLTVQIKEKWVVQVQEQINAVKFAESVLTPIPLKLVVPVVWLREH